MVIKVGYDKGQSVSVNEKSDKSLPDFIVVSRKIYVEFNTTIAYA